MTRIFLKFSVVLFLGFVVFTADFALAERRKKDDPVLDDHGRPYFHVCGAGTESVGVSGKQMWCRQPILGGYRRQGGFIEWYANGKKRTAGEFQRDRKHGVWIRYYPNGKKREEIEYHNGKEIRKTKYDRRGKVIDASLTDARRAKSKELTKKLREAHSWRKPKENR